ncbi:hypothetical protein SDC9_157654 [bioreactor metagenome]|uniref:DRTGG domain-containing protein n=1 Tax=bioreactor metagenome TaxID=1076179 RepID=A0A645FAK1_9ZZZZ
MTVKELIEKMNLTVLAGDDALDKAVDGCYCGDLLSWVMSRGKEGNVWITVMGNINSIAVAVLNDVSCIILSEHAALNEDAKMRAQAENIPVLQSSRNTYELAKEFSKIVA